MTTPQTQHAKKNGRGSSNGAGSTRESKPPFPRQHQGKPGLEHKISPAPRYSAPRYRAAGKLEGKVALITGGDSRIGRAVANLYAREGADVAIVFLPAEAADAEQVSWAKRQQDKSGHAIS